MTEPLPPVGRERALLVGLLRPEDPVTHEEPLAELARLADTAGAVVVERIVQKRRAIHPATFIGRGKAREIAETAAALDVDLAIFDHDLSPAQVRNLEEEIGRRVIDRSELILDIFARRARTRQARVQVELAQLEYLRPRLRRMWTHLDREVGMGSGMGIGMKGPGEKQIEMDRRIVRRQIQRLRDELAEIRRQHHTRASGRRDYFSVSLVGYTNAGKSTLLNALTGADAFTEDRLFATLDTTTRAWELGGGRRIFLSDTVGFIRGLPHHLVESFHATLEETREADLLLHVVDASNPDAQAQVGAVAEVLEAVGAGAVPVLTALNKIDRLPDRMALQMARPRNGRCVEISARTGEGLEALRRAVADEVERRQVEVEVVLDPGDGKTLAFLADKGSVLSRDYSDPAAVRVVAVLPRRYLKSLGERVRVRADAGTLPPG